ncbi:K+ channel tetramerization domain protein [Ancylostoma caninum]|uniref:K+ channel tetramerization domain protein n=1 Tax=Ancylostoma caninum TaxID=29170 RepID=A0A368H3X1_ANCCA|nr:K+ channel tetramerization domain protein [Ancylostoma caninum]
MANIISLNVGGKIFSTTAGTLQEATKLADYFKGTISNPFDDEEKKTIFIDRDPTYFPLLLKYLREGKFYGVLPLADLLRQEEGRREPFFVEDKVVWRDPDFHRLCSDMGIRFDGTTEKLPICFNPCRGRYGSVTFLF